MKDYPHDDRDLLSGCLSGDKLSQEKLFCKYSNLVYRYVQQTFLFNNVPFDDDDLKEQHNSVFVQLYDKKCKKLRQFQGKNGCTLASWIRLITCRTVLNHIRENSIDATWKTKRLPLDEAPEFIDETGDAVKSMEVTERKIFIQQSIQKLAARDRLFLKLHIEQELSVPKVASIMQISVPNAHTLKHRAIGKLKSIIESDIIEKF